MKDLKKQIEEIFENTMNFEAFDEDELVDQLLQLFNSHSQEVRKEGQDEMLDFLEEQSTGEMGYYFDEKKFKKYLESEELISK